MEMNKDKKFHTFQPPAIQEFKKTELFLSLIKLEKIHALIYPIFLTVEFLSMIIPRLLGIACVLSCKTGRILKCLWPFTIFILNFDMSFFGLS